MRRFPKLSQSSLALRVPAIPALVTAAALLIGCTDETLAGYGAAGKVWHLTLLDDQAFEAKATLTFPETGKLAGEAPCNRYHGNQTAPYPWFEVAALIATRTTCPEQASETAYLQALQQMSEAEVAGNVLILRNEAGREMVFEARP
ncbi:META domain-containing protein [Pseudophaeobacter sp.]|uniref:META domain-containing protein n=1 Tax=Pseudophaeobacter sp. TaxID=1971739 RepID=UPI00329A5F8F